ncbi:hypothetical protein J8273_2903 [Carpediemonas membranifera]|uniref:Uncharacterized protein n=1 Tax=Carpediemonas membranifera TaxID=201153 RepID=A0A8J6B916_9EUKA|nr:hypothetical protein J8273_2903 [Carpediemonas membranifera]|eukprot:KAG9395699.1 hypothetical protein J8273_2903 [Carpediemonas membranifera]
MAQSETVVEIAPNDEQASVNTEDNIKEESAAAPRQNSADNTSEEHAQPAEAPEMDMSDDWINISYGAADKETHKFVAKPGVIVRNRHSPKRDEQAYETAIEYLTALSTSMHFASFDEFLKSMQIPDEVNRFRMVELKGEIIKQLIIINLAVYGVRFRLSLTKPNKLKATKSELIDIIVYLTKFFVNPTSVGHLPSIHLCDETFCDLDGNYPVSPQFNGAGYIRKFIRNGKSLDNPERQRLQFYMRNDALPFFNFAMEMDEHHSQDYWNYKRWC